MKTIVNQSYRFCAIIALAAMALAAGCNTSTEGARGNVDFTPDECGRAGGCNFADTLGVGGITNVQIMGIEGFSTAGLDLASDNLEVLAVTPIADVGGHQVQYLGLEEVTYDNRVAEEAIVMIDGQGPYRPALNKFGARNQLIGTPAVRGTPTVDVMVSFTDLPDSPDEPASLRIIVQPFIMWLWIGGAVMALGTALSAVPSRIWRRPTDPVSARLPDLRGGPDERDRLDPRDPVVDDAEPVGV